MMLGFLQGGLSSSSWAGGRHLRGWKGWHLFFFSATGREEKRNAKRVLSSLLRGVGRQASESVSAVAAERHALINAMRLRAVKGRCLLWRSVDQPKCVCSCGCMYTVRM